MSLRAKIRGFREIFSGTGRWSELGANGVDDHDMRYNLSDFINAADRRLKIVAGEFNHRLYDTRKVLYGIEQFLQKPDAMMQIVFGGSLGDYAATEEALKHGNSDLYNLAVMFPHSLHMYMAERNPRLHYGIADSKSIFFEEPEHNVGSPPNYLYSIINGLRLVRKFEPRFDDYLEHQTIRLLIAPTATQQQ